MEAEEDKDKRSPQFELTTTMPRTYLCCNRYLLLDKLGKGGFGLIYAGVDITNGNRVAIKLVSAFLFTLTRAGGHVPGPEEVSEAGIQDLPAISQRLVLPALFSRRYGRDV
jgi:hypothetical protein